MGDRYTLTVKCPKCGNKKDSRSKQCINCYCKINHTHHFGDYAKKGNIPWNKGLTKETNESVKKYATVIRTIEWRKKQSDSLKKAWKSGTTKLGLPETIQKGLMKLLQRPTGYERKLIFLIEKHHLSFIYTGNGTFLIGTKNPDFINKKNKIAIEVYYSWFKIRNFGSCEEYEKKREKYFADYGWRVLFIKDNEIENKNWENICIKKIGGIPYGRPLLS